MGAPMEEVSEVGGDEEEEDVEEEEGASFEGKVLLSSFSGFRLTWSPRRGVGLSEFMASLVFGFERVPRTAEEWDVSTIVAGIAFLVDKVYDVWYEITMMFDRGARNLGKEGWL